MSIDDIVSLMPFLILGGTIAVLLLVAAFSNDEDLTFPLTVAGLSGAVASLLFVPRRASVTPLLAMDRYAAFYLGLILISAIAVAFLSRLYFHVRKNGTAQTLHEYYLLLLLATLGSGVLAASHHFASFFLGLEILSVSLYALISFQNENVRGIEAGIKYLILAGTSSAFLLFGMALSYASLGTMEFPQMGLILASRTSVDFLTLLGTAFLLVGIGFKLALTPFHLWSPDIYEGSPAPVGALVATISKGAVFALLLRLMLTTRLYPGSALFVTLSLLSIASMFAGNLLALRQKNIKRLLAYSSIAHMGYLLVALLAGGSLGVRAAALYLVVYFVTTLIAFGVVCLLSSPQREAEFLADYQGLLWRRPVLATLFSAAILSLAGIPLTAGFVGKFYLMGSVVSSGQWALVVILALNSALGLYYYLRVIVAMWVPLSLMTLEEKEERGGVKSLRSGTALLAVLGIFLIGLGIYPSPLLHLVQVSMDSFADSFAGDSFAH